MKITKKKPLRPRGRTDEKRQSAKDAIRDAYAHGPQREMQIIPAKKDMADTKEEKKLRVCAYCRVSTDEDTQASSYELQVQNYTKMIQENPDWQFAGIFADEGISGTSVLHREHFLEMIEKCKAGEIDLIITKQVSRFARTRKPRAIMSGSLAGFYYTDLSWSIEEGQSVYEKIVETQCEPPVEYPEEDENFEVEKE